MNIQLDFRSGMPLVTQIVEQIRQMIQQGEIKVGDQLPTVREMAAELRVNFNTVARAYRILDEAGLISTQHGRGTYIWETPDQESLQKLRTQNLKHLTVNFINEANRLGFTAEEITRAVEFQIEESNLIIRSGK